MIAGRLTVRYGGHEEVIEPGDAFSMPPGHVPAAQAGPEFVTFSPQEELGGVTGGLEGQHATADAGHLTAAAGQHQRRDPGHVAGTHSCEMSVGHRPAMLHRVDTSGNHGVHRLRAHRVHRDPPAGSVHQRNRLGQHISGPVRKGLASAAQKAADHLRPPAAAACLLDRCLGQPGAHHLPRQAGKYPPGEARNRPAVTTRGLPASPTSKGLGACRRVMSHVAELQVIPLEPE